MHDATAVAPAPRLPTRCCTVYLQVIANGHRDICRVPHLDTSLLAGASCQGDHRSYNH